MAPSQQHWSMTRCSLVSLTIIICSILNYYIFGYYANEPVFNVNIQTASLMLNNSDIQRFKVRNWSFIYYQHPRKTGGTSIRTYFKELGFCARSGWCDKVSIFKNISEHKKWNLENNAKLIVNEREPFHAQEYLRYWDTEYWNDILLVTMLRDPIKRVYSDILNPGTFNCADPYKDMTLDNITDNALMECIEKKKYKFTSNYYTKVFSGAWNYALSDRNMVIAQRDFNYIHVNAKQNVNEMHYKIAKSILEQFDILLILELWDKTHQQLLCYKLGDGILPHKNVNRQANITKVFHEGKHQKVIDLITELNQYDIRLYEYISQLALLRSKACQSLLLVENQ